MESAKRRRWIALLAALGAVSAASLYHGGDELSADTRPQAPSRRVDPTAPAANAAEAPTSIVKVVIPERLQAREIDETIEDAFTQKSWAPPPPPPPPPPKVAPKPVVIAPPPPPPPPTPPPLPYKYLGRFEEQGVVTIFLASGERNLLVKPGETLDGSYRLDSLQGNTLTFTYLPLQMQQMLPMSQPN